MKWWDEALVIETVLVVGLSFASKLQKPLELLKSGKNYGGFFFFFWSENFFIFSGKNLCDEAELLNR